MECKSLARARAWLVPAILIALAATAGAQYTTHVQKAADKPTLRATAVLEWTGELDKPSASRLIPLAVWDGEHYQPGGLYLAKPEPLALVTGTQYELEKSGEPAGFFNVRGAATMSGGAWVGLGKYQPVPPPKPPPKLKASKRLPAPTPTSAKAPAADSNDRPTLHKKTDDSAPATSSGASAPAPGPASDPDKPTLHRRSSSDSDTTASDTDTDKPTLHHKADPDTSTTSGSDSDDPDRPTLHRRGSETSEAPPDVDPDRPTLHRAPAAAAGGSGDGSIAGTAPIDPDRPTLRRGKPEAEDTVLAPAKIDWNAVLTFRQMVAVSDVKDVHAGDPEQYLYHWSSSDDEAKMRAAMEALAVKALNASSAAAQAATFGPAAHAAAKTRARALAAPAAPTLSDEAFQTYELSFSSGPTVVLSARGGPAGDRYVTLIAQPDFYGQPRVLFRQVSTAATLDQTPRMRLVDAVDTDNDRQAELIFELIGQPGPVHGAAAPREYAIYRVTAAGAEQVFATGPLP